MKHFLPSLLTISGALGLGCLVGMLFRRYASDPELLPRLRIGVQKFSLLGINPVAFVGAVWILPLDHGALFFLPLVCIAAQASGFFVGGVAMSLRPLPTAAERIGFRLSCSFSNTGNMGGLIVFLLLGEVAYALVPVYKLLEEFWCYGVLFPYARRQAIAAGLVEETGRVRHPLLRIVGDPFFLIVALSIVLGLALNLLGVERPAFYATLNTWLIPTSSFLLLMAIGSQIRIARIPIYWRPALAITVLRTTLIPPCALGFAALLGFASGDPLIMKTIAVLAVMPMAFVSLVPASLYKLDSDLVSSAWLFTTASLLCSVPLLSLLLR